MGKRGLYPLISKKNSHNNQLKLRMDIISYSDGKKSIFEIVVMSSFKKFGFHEKFFFFENHS